MRSSRALAAAILTGLMTTGVFADSAADSNTPPQPPGQKPVQQQPAEALQPPTSQPATEPAVEAEAEKTGLPFAVQATLDFPTAYYFRGDKIIGNSFLVQPFAQIQMNPIKLGEDVSVSPYLGVWMDFAERGGGHRNWSKFTEIDILPGVDVAVDRFDLKLTYAIYVFPNGSLQSSQEVNATLAFDDSKKENDETATSEWHGISWNRGLVGPIALSPYVTVAQTTYNAATHSDDTYLELGILPQVNVMEKLQVGVPILVGVTPNHYYTSFTGGVGFWGYGSAGLTGKYAINDHLDLHASVFYMNLWANSLRVDNLGGSNVVVGSAGIGFSY